MNTEPGFECPECSAKLYDKMKCPLCGWRRMEEPEAPKRAPGWYCDACGAQQPHGGSMIILDRRELCGRCHFEERIRPFASKPTDICDAVHGVGRNEGEYTETCADPAHASWSPHHHVAAHIAEFRRLVALIDERNEAIKLQGTGRSRR